MVNQKDDHKGLGLCSRFIRYLFANIFLALRAHGGLSCGKEVAPSSWWLLEGHPYQLNTGGSAYALLIHGVPSAAGMNLSCLYRY